MAEKTLITKPSQRKSTAFDNVENAIPLLRDMDSDFQRKLPALTINALAFEEHPNTRFVIIDMTKYRIGQKIKGSIQLIDILPNSLILRYENRDFRLEGS